MVYKSHDAYHIVQDNVINRRDYSLLFEGEDERHHIPVGVTDQLNIYGSVTITPTALRTISRENILIAQLNDYGDLMGTYVPEGHTKAADVFLGQCGLYNRLLQIIWKTSLGPKMGVVHATNRRSYSLNLDFADIFKPIVIDRVIISLINRREIRAGDHFRESHGGVPLSADGKRLFPQHLDQKPVTKVGSKTGKTTYPQLLTAEVAAFQRLVRDSKKYRPYKYY